jgi:hypothetical protein
MKSKRYMKKIKTWGIILMSDNVSSSSNLSFKLKITFTFQRIVCFVTEIALVCCSITFPICFFHCCGTDQT